MEQKQFVEILRRYQQGKASPEEKKLIDGWYLALGNSVDEKEVPEESVLLAQFEPILEEHLRKSDRSKKTRSVIYWWAGGVAASFIVIFSFYFIGNNTSPVPDPLMHRETFATHWKETFNDSKAPLIVTLPDSSVVTLEPGGTLRFPQQFAVNERAVYLLGQAFFEVTPEKTRPFFVHTGEVTTRVLGTSFTIKSNDKKIVVAVRTGKVSVFAKPDTAGASPAKGVILTPNQQAVYDKADEKLSKGIVDSPQPLISREEFKRIKFEEASANKIFETLEKVYGIDLVFDEHKFSSCLLNTTISDDELYKKLDILCKAVGGKYEFREDKILITGTGCN